MNRQGPIVLIDDDQDDRFLFQTIFKELGLPNELVIHSDGAEALKYLEQDHVVPFLILSDLNMPRLGGLELKSQINANEALADKCLPYILYSTYMDKTTVSKAYKLGVQGVFKKPSDYSAFVEIIRSLVDYWRLNYCPNRFAGSEAVLK